MSWYLDKSKEQSKGIVGLIVPTEARIAFILRSQYAQLISYSKAYRK